MIGRFFEPEYFTHSFPRFFKKTLPRFFTRKIPSFFKNLPERIEEKFFSYLEYAVRPLGVWKQVHTHRIHLTPKAQTDSQNMVDTSYPFSFSRHFKQALGFIYGDDDVDGVRIAGGFAAGDSNFSDVIDGQWQRFLLNPFHLLNICIALTKALLFSSADKLDRFFLPRYSLTPKETHGFFKFWKGLWNLCFMFIDPFVTIPLKLLGDLADAPLYIPYALVYAPLRFVVGCIQGFGYLVKQCCCATDVVEKTQKHVKFNDTTIEVLVKTETVDEKKSELKTPPPTPKTSKQVSPLTPSSRRRTLQREKITHAKVHAALEHRRHQRQPTELPAGLIKSASEKHIVLTTPPTHKKQKSQSLHDLKIVAEEKSTTPTNIPGMVNFSR